MKRILLFSFAALIHTVALAQPYCNEWIDFNQTYYKIKVWTNAVHRIDAATLQSAGVPVSSIDPRRMQIFHNGQQEYIYVEGENDGTFDSGDFIEFIGRANDGSFDKQLYADSMWQPNIRYSNFTDTSIYFLTWSSTSNGLRFLLEIDSDYSSYSPSPYCLKEAYFQQNYKYNLGMSGQSIDYTEGEGWCGEFGNAAGGTLSVPLNTQNVYTAGPDVQMTTSIGGINNLNHSIWIAHPQDTLTDFYTTQTHRQYAVSFPPTLLTSPTTTVYYGVSTPSASNDMNAFYYCTLVFPHTFDFENSTYFEFQLPDGQGQSKSRLDITNFNGNGRAPLLYDLTNHRRIALNGSGSTWQTLIPNDNRLVPKQCLISAVSQSISVASLNPVDYVPGNPGKFHNFSISPIDSAFVMISHKALWNEATAYQNYRNQTTNNRTLLVDIDELTDQYAYGIQKHPMSIKNFSRFLLDNWTSVGPPQHLFLIGKSIMPYFVRTNPNLFAKSLVTTYGVPASDILLTAGIHGTLYETAIPVGRICARNGNEVLDYLDKVQEYESAQAGPPQKWMKEILHFGGGNDPQQQAQLASYLNDYERSMEGPYFGGNVTTYLKFTNQPIVINQSDSLQNKIDSGVAVMTFFGHASGSSFDQSTDEPSEYNNRGRYPLIVANSCLAGGFHVDPKSISEKFVLEPEKAAIGFLASVGYGVPEDLFLYSRAFFQGASISHYQESVGQLMKYATQSIQVPNSENIKNVCQDMSLNGDPSIKLNGWSKPDFDVSESSIRFPSYDVTTTQDTFSIHVITRNIAKAVTDSFVVKVTRTFPDGTDSSYSFRRGNCYYQDDLVITFSTGGLNSAGINLFSVNVDPADSVDEFDNIGNNSASSSLFIQSNNIIPVYPPKFAIIGNNRVKLKASTSNPLSGFSRYRFEIDTVDLSLSDSIPSLPHSPLFSTTTVSDSGGVIFWDLFNYPLQDSLVYYWRVANDSIYIAPSRFNWQQSSFQYIPTISGWGQSSFFQTLENNFENLRLDTLNRITNYVNNLKNLSVLTKGLPDGSQTGYNEIGYKLNGNPIEYNACQITPAILVAVLDSTTLLPWNTCGNNFGQSNQFTLTSGNCSDPLGVTGTGTCRQRPENHFMFHYYNPSEMQGLNNLVNTVPDGNYILFYSWYTANYSSVDPNFFNAILGLGLDTTNFRDNIPYIFFIQKGNTSSAASIFGISQSDTLTFDRLLAAKWDRGIITSLPIGPALRWDALHWNQSPLESISGQDSVYLNVLGLNNTTQRWDTLTTGIPYTPGSKDTLLNWIPNFLYNYIKLQLYVQDDSLYTPPQLDYWRVYYQEAPECAINPNRAFSLHSNPLQEGDTLRVGVAIDNIGSRPMDSLDVDFYLYTNSRQRINLGTLRFDSLRVNNYLIAGIHLDSTLGLSGLNSLWIEANPYNARHQIEQTHFNNLAEVKFTVNRDQVNPLLDVTFDGIHILDRDIVSGKPEITIRLQDENRFLALNDTSKFKVYLKSPNSTVMERIYFSLPVYGQAMKFYPAVLPKNSCRIEWTPVLAEDGIYSLEVEAADMSNNESGKYNYKITFEVINRSTITEILNYPNPFSTSTRFVFTLTGNETPTYMKIQIMTVSGKIVREITQSELGNIHVGRNITDYAWDGKDEFGDQLANGLYLYRVISSIRGEDIEKRSTSADEYFKKGWGKMYLMR